MFSHQLLLVTVTKCTQTNDYMHTYTYSYMHTCPHSYMYKCTYSYIHTCPHSYMYKCTYSYMHTCMPTQLHVHMHIQLHVQMHVQLHASLQMSPTYLLHQLSPSLSHFHHLSVPSPSILSPLMYRSLIPSFIAFPFFSVPPSSLPTLSLFYTPSSPLPPPILFSTLTVIVSSAQGWSTTKQWSTIYKCPGVGKVLHHVTLPPGAAPLLFQYGQHVLGWTGTHHIWRWGRGLCRGLE